MKIFLLIGLVLSLANGLVLDMKALDFNGIDYLPATTAFTKIKSI